MEGHGFISLEVEDNDNCPGLPLMTYQRLGRPARVIQVRIAGPHWPEELHWVTGWQSDGGGSPCPAHYVRISDSGAGSAVLLYGGDWGIRLMRGNGEEWDTDSPEQWGEPWLVLGEESDIVAEDSG